MCISQITLSTCALRVCLNWVWAVLYVSLRAHDGDFCTGKPKEIELETWAVMLTSNFRHHARMFFCSRLQIRVTFQLSSFSLSFYSGLVQWTTKCIAFKKKPFNLLFASRSPPLRCFPVLSCIASFSFPHLQVFLCCFPCFYHSDQ